MKKILLLLTCILFSITCFAQKMDLTYATITKPAGLIKMKKEQIPPFTKAHFKKNEALKKFVYDNDKTVYRVGNIMVVINCEKRQQHEPPLEKTQEFLSSQGPTILKPMGDKTYLQLTQNFEGVLVYRFFCVDKAQKALFAGLIQYEPADKAKATKILGDMIKSLKFKA